MKKHTLHAKSRTETGRKVKHLRLQGLIPANIYGKQVESTPVTLTEEEFVSVYGEAGESSLVEVALDGSVRPVLIHDVQRHPVTWKTLHVELYQVNLKEKVQTKVPLSFIGESKAETDKIGVVLKPLSEVEVEALPADLPEHIDVDISSLNAVGDELHVADIHAPSGVTILSDATLLVANVGELVSKEAEAQAAADVAVQAEATAATEAAAPPVESSEAPAKE